jgi:hypothetical protein
MKLEFAGVILVSELIRIATRMPYDDTVALYRVVEDDAPNRTSPALAGVAIGGKLHLLKLSSSENTAKKPDKPDIPVLTTRP